MPSRLSSRCRQTSLPTQMPEGEVKFNCDFVAEHTVMVGRATQEMTFGNKGVPSTTGSLMGSSPASASGTHPSGKYRLPQARFFLTPLLSLRSAKQKSATTCRLSGASVIWPTRQVTGAPCRTTRRLSTCTTHLVAMQQKRTDPSVCLCLEHLLAYFQNATLLLFMIRVD